MTVTAMNPAETADPPKKGKKKLVIIVLLLVVAAAAAYMLVLKPHKPSAPEPGQKLPVDEETVNLAGGHYLTIQVELTFAKTAKADVVDESVAQQDVIRIFSGQTVGDVDTARVRENLLKELTTRIEDDYDHQVLDVILTKYVTQ
jgi:flagellar protein FliL